jgi:hypothetical protein
VEQRDDDVRHEWRLPEKARNFNQGNAYRVSGRHSTVTETSMNAHVRLFGRDRFRQPGDRAFITPIVLGRWCAAAPVVAIDNSIWALRMTRIGGDRRPRQLSQQRQNDPRRRRRDCPATPRSAQDCPLVEAVRCDGNEDDESSLCGCAIVAMVQPVDLRNRDDVPRAWRHHGPLGR